MPLYVDGFLLPIKKNQLAAYRPLAKLASRVWRKCGALEYRECAGDDLNIKGMGTSFPKQMKCGPSETVVFAWIVYKSKSDRNRVNAKVMKDPAIKKMMNAKSMPFELKRMLYGGFKVIVDA